MPKSSGKRRVQTAPNERLPELKEKLRLRKSVQEQELDKRRSHLLAEILNVSTNLSIDESTSPTSARQAVQDHAPLLDLLEELKAVESTLNPELPKRNDSSWMEFFKWIDSRQKSASPAATSQDKVPLSSRVGVEAAAATQKPKLIENSPERNEGINSLGENEYSLITKVPIKMGDQVFAVDRELMLTTETASRDVDLDDFIRNDMIASGMQNVVLVLHLLNEYSKRERSHWWPYLSILPNKLLPILNLNKKKLERNLLASAHIFEALKMLRAIARQYSYFSKRLESTKLPLKHDFTFIYYAWGVSIVCSRQNEIPLRSQARDHHHHLRHHQSNIHALIPLLDMCNHDLHSNQAIFLDNASCLMAPADLQAGQEITINYGCRSSGDFYIHNGFVPDEVPNDMVPMTIALSNDHLLEAKTKLLKLLNMPKVMGRFKLICNEHANRHRRDPHLTMFLVVYCLNQEELELIMASQNLVGLADYIYDYIQYKMYEPDGAAQTTAEHDKDLITSGGGDGGGQGEQIDKMKLRLADCYKDYLSRRASVCIALIDRALEQMTTPKAAAVVVDDEKNVEAAEQQQGDDELHAIRLLQKERKIYESYLRRGEETKLNGNSNK